MPRYAFYSFHYALDAWRASQVRNIGVVDGNKPATDNDWETVKRGGDAAIQRWIDSQLEGKSVVIVLIGTETANRKWIDYEIRKGWGSKKGVLGIHIHNLKNSEGKTTSKGTNPFINISMSGGGKLSDYATAYDPPFSDSVQVYEHIKNNLSSWIEAAIRARG